MLFIHLYKQNGFFPCNCVKWVYAVKQMNKIRVISFYV